MWPFVCLNQFFWSPALKFAKTLPRHIGATLALSLIVGLGFSLSACNKKPVEPAAKVAAPAVVAAPAPVATTPTPSALAPEVKAADITAAVTINWEEMPDLKDIGNFPFVTAPKGLAIESEKNGLSEFFSYEQMQNYTGNGIYSTEGKLGVIHFSSGEYNQRFFDKSILSYLDGIGAKKIYEGVIPSDDVIREKFKKNLYNGKSRTVGLSAYSDPIYFYAFKNNAKKFVINVQSNTAKGQIFIMELEDFKQSIQKYSAESMKKEIEATGKAVLNINFDTDKATLKADGQTVVNQIAVLLKNNTGLKLSIEGHTDNTGSAERNKKLSIDRTNTVMLALVADGINKNDLKSTGYGSEKPLAANDTEENKTKNRRVELVKF